VRGVNVQGDGNTVEKTNAFGNVEVGIALFVDDKPAARPQCPRCAYDCRPAARLCEECEISLATKCANCGSELSPTAKGFRLLIPREPALEVA
jgi:hypothetical protein